MISSNWIRQSDRFFDVFSRNRCPIVCEMLSILFILFWQQMCWLVLNDIIRSDFINSVQNGTAAAASVITLDDFLAFSLIFNVCVLVCLFPSDQITHSQLPFHSFYFISSSFFPFFFSVGVSSNKIVLRVMSVRVCAITIARGSGENSLVQ